MNYKNGDMVVAEYLSQRTFAVPGFPELTSEERTYIVESLKEAIQRVGRTTMSMNPAI